MALPKYMRTNAMAHKKALRHEKRVATERGDQRARTLPNSGSLPHSPYDGRTAAADVIDAHHLIQHRATIKDSYGIKRDDLALLSEEARRRAKQPMMMILFERERRCESEWVLVTRAHFEALERAAKGESDAE